LQQQADRKRRRRENETSIAAHVARGMKMGQVPAE